MKLNPTLLKVARQNSDVLPGNVYPAKGGRKTPGTEFWLVVAVSDTGAHCIGYDRNGNPVSTASYLKSALAERTKSDTTTSAEKRRTNLRWGNAKRMRRPLSFVTRLSRWRDTRWVWVIEFKKLEQA